MQVYVDMVRNKMIDVVVATGASIIDMDLFEALGFKHYKGRQHIFLCSYYSVYFSQTESKDQFKASCQNQKNPIHNPSFFDCKGHEFPAPFILHL